jgi:DNA-binding beta-propeller fold protein YncE
MICPRFLLRARKSLVIGISVVKAICHALIFLIFPPVVFAASDLPNKTYYVYVCAESEDEVAVIRFGPDGLEVVKTIAVGSIPVEIEGPHGIDVAPNGQHWYVSTSHGFPFGSVYKYETATDQLVGSTTLGMYPATLDVSASTGLLYVANFNLHGPLEPGTVSIVEAETMTEISRIDSGVRPHGARLNKDETRLYSVNVMDSELVEIDARGFEVTRQLLLGDDVNPTWVTEPTDDGRLFVAGNSVAKIFEIDIETWKVVRELDSGPGPYNIDLSKDESVLVVTYKENASVGFFDLPSGKERARVDTIRTVPHGVVITPDSEYAFVTVEGVGSEPGTVEVYHVPSAQRVDAVDIGKQAGGIAFWKIE